MKLASAEVLFVDSDGMFLFDDDEEDESPETVVPIPVVQVKRSSLASVELSNSPQTPEISTPNTELRRRQRLCSEGIIKPENLTRSRSRSDWADKSEEKKIYETLGQGDYFGGTSIIENNGISVCSYISKDKVSLLMLPATEFSKLIIDKVFKIIFSHF